MENRPKHRTIIGWVIVPLIAIVAVGAWFALDPGFRQSWPAKSLAADNPDDAFGQRVRAYLLEHPEVIIEAIRRFEGRQQAAAESEARAAITRRTDELLRDGDSPVGGNPEGDVTLVEFFDYNCPYCRQVAPVMEKAAAADARRPP